MSYLVHVTFDIQDASPKVYSEVTQSLADAGLFPAIVGASKKSQKLPANTFTGQFKGESAATVRDDICKTVKDAFLAQGLTGKIFVTVGGDWAWGTRTT